MQGIFDVWLLARPRTTLHRFAGFGAATSPAKSAGAFPACAARNPETAIRVFAVTAMLIAAWFLYFAGDGLWAPFTLDDLMNLHGYMQKSPAALLTDNLRYWSTAYRPLGGLFYVALYRLFGFNPLPFRIFCFALLGANLGLLFVFSRQISRSGEVAFFATFLLSYHAWFVDLYYSSGTVYDLLCFGFYFLAFTFYIRIRQAGRLPDWRESVALAALYICALNAKEMAVTLPLFMLIYEWIFHPPQRRGLVRGAFNGARITLILGALTVPYLVGKLTGAGSLIQNPAYQLSVSPGRFLDAFHLYLNPLLYQDHVFRDSNTVQMLIAMLAFALWRRSRAMIFSWLFLLLSILPFAFINHYAAFFMYIPAVGWAIYAGELLALVRRELSHVLQRLFSVGQPITAVAVVFALVAVAIAPLHLRERPKTSRLFQRVQPPTREMARELLKQQLTMKPGARLLFVSDPFPKDQYFLLFLARLLYHDMSLEVVRTAVNPVPPAGYGQYDAVFIFGPGIAITRWSNPSRPKR